MAKYIGFRIRSGGDVRINPEDVSSILEMNHAEFDYDSMKSEVQIYTRIKMRNSDVWDVEDLIEFVVRKLESPGMI